MRIAEYKQTGTELVTSVVTVDDHDSDGNIIGQHEETITGEKAVFGLVYRDATDEEIAAMKAREEEETEQEPTLEEQVADLTDLVAVLSEVICGD